MMGFMDEVILKYGTENQKVGVSKKSKQRNQTKRVWRNYALLSSA